MTSTSNTPAEQGIRAAKEENAGNQQFNVRLPDLTHDCIDLLVETYGLTKTQVIILAVDRLTRDLYPDGNNRRAITEALILADSGNETGSVEQA